MCGIAALLSRDAKFPVKRCMEKMLESISHRGPDGREMTFLSQGFALGSVRLAMEDPKQKYVIITNKENTVHLAFNGEIYNWRTIRQNISEEFYSFTTQGDGESIIALYLTEGIEGVKKIDGMFAFILYDNINRKVFAGRDRYGIKPLYMTQRKEGVAFCSDLNGIKSIFPVEIDYYSLFQYFKLRYIPSPYSVYKNVTKFKAGEIVELYNGSIKTILNLGLPNEKPFYSLKDSLSMSVSSMVSSDSKIGAFLSGGLDSSSIVASLYNQGIKIPLFSIGYENSKYEDETLYARNLANLINGNLKVITLNNIDVSEAISSSILAMDEPIYSTVTPSTWALSRFASQYVKGVLSGDGSDELLMGYHYIRDAQQQKDEYSIIKKYQQGIEWIDSGLLSEMVPWTQQYTIDNYFFHKKENYGDAEEFMRDFEIKSRLPDYQFARVDKMSMAHGLEVRVPFLRDDVVKSCLSYNAKDLVEKKEPKTPLIKCINEWLESSKWSRNKQPFTAPIQYWLESKLVPDFESVILDGKVCKFYNFNRDGIIRLIGSGSFSDNWREVWGIYLISYWIEHHG